MNELGSPSSHQDSLAMKRRPVRLEGERELGVFRISTISKGGKKVWFRWVGLFDQAMAPTLRYLLRSTPVLPLLAVR
jgi:hypothetical protein